MSVPLPSYAELEQVPTFIQMCMSHNRSMSETMDILFANLNIPLPYTRIVWGAMESDNPALFQAYYERMNLMFPTHDCYRYIYNGVDYLNQNQIIQWARFVNWVEGCIRYSMEHNMTKQETINYIFSSLKILPALTRTLWEMLEEENPQVFQAYYARLEFLRQNPTRAPYWVHNQGGGGLELMVQHLNGARNATRNQNAGGLVAPNAAAQNAGGLELMIQHLNGAQNATRNQNAGGLVAPNATQNSGGLELMIQHLNGARNATRNQNAGGLVAPNAAAQNAGGLELMIQHLNGAQNATHNQNAGELVAPNAAAQNVVERQNQQPQVNNDQNGVDHQRGNNQI